MTLSEAETHRRLMMAPHRRFRKNSNPPELPSTSSSTHADVDSDKTRPPSPRPPLRATQSLNRPIQPDPRRRSNAPTPRLAPPTAPRARGAPRYPGTPTARYTFEYDERGALVSQTTIQGPRPPPAIPRPNTVQRGGRDAPQLPKRKPSASWEETHVEVQMPPGDYRDAMGIHKLLFKYGHVSYIDCSGRIAKVTLAFHRPELFTDKLRINGRELNVTWTPKGPEMVVFPPASRFSIKKRTTVPLHHIDFGVMTAEQRMMNMHTVMSSVHHPATLKLDMTERRYSLDIRFFLTTEADAPWYRFELRLNSPMTIKRVLHDDGRKDLIITSKVPPRWFQSIGLDLLEEVHSDKPNRNRFTDWPRGWRRVTDIDLNPDERDLSPVAFVHPSPVIDTGRWLTWRLSFPENVDNTDYNMILKVLEDHNVVIENVTADQLSSVPRQDPVVWNLLDPHQAFHASELHELQDDMMHLSSDVRYQLEVCISRGKLIEYNMSKDFIYKLGEMDMNLSGLYNDKSVMSPALVLLENLADCKRAFFDPMEIFAAGDLRKPRKRRIHPGSVLMRSAIITPTTFYVETPGVEISNRVVRDNWRASDNFLRVKFEDETIFGRIGPVPDYDNQHEVWERIERCLRHGIDIAGRHYDWLACGNSQFRERGAYFFSPFDGKTASSIRTALGDFSQINVVAKCMARIGQCFSTTRASTNIGRVDFAMIEDIKRNGYCFTDGVGKVSTFVAQMVANEMYTRHSPGDFPSAFQFRLGGSKGILVVDPSLKGKEIRLRPSQQKFDAPSVGLEIIKPSRFSTATLNQQIILVLTGVGVEKRVFVDKMANELQNIDRAMHDEGLALHMLQKNVDFNQVTCTIAGMVLDGFMQSQEPFFEALMQLWRAWNLQHLREKAKIPVENSAFVLGCVDETNTLKMDCGKLPEIFLQIPGEKDGEWKVVKGICQLARNPSLHPGDIRVVEAVECEGLKHLKNVVVLPQQGIRPLGNMCSGGDLDGDDYLVMWDDDLLPPKSQWHMEPMNYDAPTPVMCIGAPQDEDLIKFFVDYIKNDNLGQIAVNHRTMADWEAQNGGVKNEKCLRLAQLHSEAVDYNKTGVPAKMSQDLRPAKNPHWHLGGPEHKKYHSKQVLGVLFDMVQCVEYDPLLDKPFDRRILEAYVLSEEMLDKARNLKLEYDQDMRRIMAQYGIRTEFEIWSAFVMDPGPKWYTLAEELGNKMANIKSHFQDHVRKALELEQSYFAISEESFVGKLGPFVAAMYTVTAQELSDWQQTKLISTGEDNASRPMISFPWLFAKELGKIAVKSSGPSLLMQSSGVKRKEPATRRKFAQELDSLKLEPLAEWTPEVSHAEHTATDHVEMPTLKTAAVSMLEVESAEATDASAGAEDVYPASSRSTSALASSRSGESGSGTPAELEMEDNDKWEDMEQDTEQDMEQDTEQDVSLEGDQGLNEVELNEEMKTQEDESVVRPVDRLMAMLSLDI